MSGRPGRALLWLAIVGLATIALLGTEIIKDRNPSSADYGPVLSLDGVVGLAPAGAPVPVVVWMGDSTASGVGVLRPEDALPRQTASLVGAPERVVSLAVSGARISGVLGRQVPRVPPDADVIVIDVGANDVTHAARLATFHRQYEAVLRRLPARVAVILLGVPDVGSARRLDQPLRAIAGWRGRSLSTVIRGLARRHHAAFVDIARSTGPAFRHDPKRYFFRDGYHPDAAGYRLWAQAVAPALSAALARAGPPR